MSIYDDHRISFINISLADSKISFLYQVQAMHNNNIIMQTKWALYNSNNFEQMAPPPRTNNKEELWRDYFKNICLNKTEIEGVHEWLEIIKRYLMKDIYDQDMILIILNFFI